jgi:ketosteroid isomerase-like protein
MKRMILLVVLVAVLGLADRPAITADEPKTGTPEQLIRAVLNSQAEAWNKGKLEEFMAGYWNAKELTFYSGKEKRLGWDETLDRYKKRYQSDGKEMGKLTFSDLEIQTLGADHAVVKGRWLVEMSKEKLDGLFTLIMRKTDKGWKIIHDHTSG